MGQLAQWTDHNRAAVARRLGFRSSRRSGLLLLLTAAFCAVLASSTAHAAPHITGTNTLAPGTVDLSAEGTADWVHWGLGGLTGFNRKTGVPPLISNFSAVGGGAQTSSSTFTGYTWTDGTPTAATTNSKIGLRIFTDTWGFQYTVPADTTARTLKAYMGLKRNATGTVTVSLSDGSAPDYVVDLSYTGSGKTTRLLTIDYEAASAGQTLTVTYVKTNATTFIALEAASLAVSAGGNQPPTLAAIGTQNAIEDQPWSVGLSATDDAPGSGLTFTETNDLPGMPNILTDNGDGTAQLNYTPNIGDAANSPYSVTVTVTDAEGADDEETFTLNINEPSSGSGSLNGTDELAPGSINLTTEGTADWVHWGLNAVPGLNRKDGVMALISPYTPIQGGPQTTSSVQARYTWTDGTPTASTTSSGRGLRMFQSGRGAEITVPADTTTRTLRMYIGLKSGATGTVTATLSDASAPDYVVNLSQGSGRSTRVITLTYTAESAGQTLTFRWEKTNGTAWTSLEAATLQVMGNAPPVLAAIGNQNAVETLPLSIPLSATDDGPLTSLTFSQTNTLPGTPNILTDNGDGTAQLDWTPAVNDNLGSPYSVTVTVADGSGAEDEETFSITVAANQAPVLTAIGNQNAVEGSPLSVALSATDDGPLTSLTFSQTNNLPGTPNILTDNGNGTAQLDWTPAIGDAAGSPYSVTVTVTDGLTATDDETFMITVAANQDPVLSPIGNQNVVEGVALNIPLSATDDGPLTSLTFSQTNNLPGTPNILTDNGNGTGALNWTPSSGDAANSPYTVTVTVTDASGADDDETFTITVAPPPNQDPVLSFVGDRNAVEGVPLSIPLTATDDGPLSSLTFSQSNTLPGTPNILTDNGDGTATLNWTPGAGDATGSPYSVTVTVSDAQGGDDDETFAINVTAAGAGELTGSDALAPSNVDLTTEGTLDWTHWGLGGIPGLDRKTGVMQMISDFSPINGGGGQTASTVQARYSWTDGTPTATGSATNTGLRTFVQNWGYQITVPADTNTRTLKVYVGLKAATGTVTASLSDSSAPDYTVNLSQGSGRSSRVITLTYRAGSNNETLTFTFEKTNATAWISLEAATLVGPPASFLPFSENFSSGAPNWSIVDETGNGASWNTTGGTYNQANFMGFSQSALDGGYQLGTYSYLDTGTGLTDYSATVTATPTAETGQAIGLMARMNAAMTDFLRLSFSTSDGFGRLESVVGSSFGTLAKNGRGVLPNTTVDLQMEVQGPVTIASVDGATLFGAYDSNHSAGTVALWCRDACSFDNVNITDLNTAPKVAISTPADFTVATSTTFAVAAVVINRPTTPSVDFSITGVPAACTAATETSTGLFEASCTVGTEDTYELVATLNDNGSPVDSHTSSNVSVGDSMAAVGDSITNGLDDNTAGDGSSSDGGIVSIQGYEAHLTDKLNTAESEPNIVFNNGVPGDNSGNLLDDRITHVLERHSDASDLIVIIGVNDANGTTPTPSGMGCTTSCDDTYKGNLQAVIDQAVAAGKNVLIPLTPPRFGDPMGAPYPIAETHTRNLLIRDEYNFVINNELTGHTVGPDLYDFFLGAQNRFDLYATNLHPNALGYYVYAHLISNSITGGSTPPDVNSNLCVRLTQSGSCESPQPYKQNLIESGDELWVDGSFTLTGSIPAALDDGRWILTANADSGQSNSDFLTFDLPGSSTVYVAYDDAATSIPTWLSNDFTDSGMTISTSNPSATTLRLYQQTSVSGEVQLGGADDATTGAGANYIVITVTN